MRVCVSRRCICARLRTRASSGLAHANARPPLRPPLAGWLILINNQKQMRPPLASRRSLCALRNDNYLSASSLVLFLSRFECPVSGSEHFLHCRAKRDVLIKERSSANFTKHSLSVSLAPSLYLSLYFSLTLSLSHYARIAIVIVISTLPAELICLSSSRKHPGDLVPHFTFETLNEQGTVGNAKIFFQHLISSHLKFQ